MSEHPPVLMIGIDAADASLIETMIEAGELPSLAAMQREGCFGRLRSDGRRFVGGIWPTVYTSREPPWHGLYHK